MYTLFSLPRTEVSLPFSFHATASTRQDVSFLTNNMCYIGRLQQDEMKMHMKGCDLVFFFYDHLRPVFQNLKLTEVITLMLSITCMPT